VFAYNAGPFSALWRPWTKHFVPETKIPNLRKAGTAG
jgi:hypothetical protein